MSQLVDNLIAFRILNMLVTPFEQTKSYQLGIIDKNGNPLKKIKDMSWTEKDNYTMLHRMIFRLKKIMEKIPVVNTKIGTLATAYFLVKECYENGKTAVDIERVFVDLLTKVEQNEITLIEEFIIVEEFLQEIDEDAPANVTGAGISTDEPVIRKKKFKKIKVSPTVFSRYNKSNKVIKEQYDKEIYSFVKINPNILIILENEETKEYKLIKFAKSLSSWQKVAG